MLSTQHQQSACQPPLFIAAPSCHQFRRIFCLFQFDLPRNGLGAEPDAFGKVPADASVQQAKMNHEDNVWKVRSDHRIFFEFLHHPELRILRTRLYHHYSTIQGG
jgi:hypothetical protein